MWEEYNSNPETRTLVHKLKPEEAYGLATWSWVGRWEGQVRGSRDNYIKDSDKLRSLLVGTKGGGRNNRQNIKLGRQQQKNLLQSSLTSWTVEKFTSWYLRWKKEKDVTPVKHLQYTKYRMKMHETTIMGSLYYHYFYNWGSWLQRLCILPKYHGTVRDRAQIQTYLGLLNSIAHDPSIMLFWWRGG